MDVNTDGSDGDRNYAIDGSSQFFQPQTSYRWKKLTERPNPFLGVAERKLTALKAEFGQKGLTAERNRELKTAIDDTNRRIYDLQNWSFLISEADPFIVLPGFVLRDSESAYSPQLGDYAVVIYEGKVYPAIVGDAGPSFKMGEASMRLCKQLNPKSSALSRPVSTLRVSYLVFPGTAEPPATPDIAKWNERCKELLNEIGGIAPELFQWENIVPAWPTPTPSPTPLATPTAVDPVPSSSSEALIQETPSSTSNQSAIIAPAAEQASPAP